MSLSLATLLWCCAWISGIAFCVLHPRRCADRWDAIRLFELLGYLVIAPCFFIFSLTSFLVFWSHKMNPVVWRRR